MDQLKLFSCHFGSKLYGTQTPTSDTDVKHIVLPSLDHLLLGKGVSNKFNKTNKAKDTRNTKDDVDEEFIPLQVFARDFMMGQTYAIELAYAIEGNHANQTFHPVTTIERQNWYLVTGDVKLHPFYIFTRELRERFMTSNIKAMMGYVVNQASLYSFKGERLNAAQDVLRFLEMGGDDRTIQAEWDDPMTASIREDAFELAQKYPKYFRVGEYDIGGGRQRPCFYLLEKTLPFTSTIKYSRGVVQNIINKYGSRAEAASESNVDWKATMHAVRIVDEGLALLQGQWLRFPFKESYVSRLLSIKRGELPLDPIREELNLKLEQLKELEQTTTLQPYSPELEEKFTSWLVSWLKKFYSIHEPLRV